MDHPGLLTAIITAPDVLHNSSVLTMFLAPGDSGVSDADDSLDDVVVDWRGRSQDAGRLAYPTRLVTAPPSNHDQVENPDDNIRNIILH